MFDFLKKRKSNIEKTIDPKLQAIAAILIEAALIDQDFGKKERDIIAKILKTHFGLSEDYNVNELIEETVSKLESSGDLITYTRTIKENWDLKNRIEIIEMMWKVCLIDNKIEPYEDMPISESTLSKIKPTIEMSNGMFNEYKAYVDCENPKDILF